MRKWMRALCGAAAVVFVLGSGDARALSVSLFADGPIAGPGADVVITLAAGEVKGTDGGGLIRAYDLQISFDPAVLQLVAEDISIDTAPFGGLPAAVIDRSVVPGLARVAVFVSRFDVDDETLRALQMDGFPLASLRFVALASAQTPLGAPGGTISGLDGFGDPQPGARAFTSSGVLVLPEPGSVALLALGLAGLARRARPTRAA